MVRIRAGWLILGSCGLLALQACGGTSDSQGGSGGARSDGGASGGPSDVTGGAGSTNRGGSEAGNRSTGVAGRVESGGASAGGATSVTGGVGGTAGTGGAAAAGGRTSGCVEGAACNCKKLTGTTKCTNDGAQCVCPPATECQNEPGTPCFEPCGGDPFGVWRLEQSCFSAGPLMVRDGCEPFLNATPKENEITLRIADGGEFASYGKESWTVSSEVPLACLSIGSVNRCKDATFYSEISVFGATGFGRGAAECKANACGVCDCEGTEDNSTSPQYDGWRRSGTQLTLANVTVDYCVQGNTLWLGGKDASGAPRAAYKFSKHSCTGTPTPCAQRTLAQCEMSGDCVTGHCKGKTSSQLGCDAVATEQDCGITEGCVWETGGCYGDALSECYFDTCDEQPGCSWGDPKQHCAGEVQPCCQGSFSGASQCSLLDAASCSKAKGCALTNGSCTGEAVCADQSDSAICAQLGCSYPTGCKMTKCSDLSVAECHSEVGCRVEW